MGDGVQIEEVTIGVRSRGTRGRLGIALAVAVGDGDQGSLRMRDRIVPLNGTGGLDATAVGLVGTGAAGTRLVGAGGGGVVRLRLVGLGGDLGESLGSDASRHFVNALVFVGYWL